MGDLRNKTMKELRRLAHEAWLAKHQPSGPAPTLPRCRCGHSFYETKIWHIQHERWRSGFYCLVCMPLQDKLDLIRSYASAGLPYDASEHGDVE